MSRLVHRDLLHSNQYGGGAGGDLYLLCMCNVCAKGRKCSIVKGFLLNECK